MNPELLARVIALVQKNGDKVVLADPATGNGVVVMDLAQYEALSALAPAVSAAPQPAAAPVVSGAKTSASESEKSAETSQNQAKKKGIRVTPETMGSTHLLADLTQEQLVDKINRDIGNWKTVQDSRRGEKPAVVPRPTEALEDEEKFFLEPIE